MRPGSLQPLTFGTCFHPEPLALSGFYQGMHCLAPQPAADDLERFNQGLQTLRGREQPEAIDPAKQPAVIELRNTLTSACKVVHSQADCSL